MLFPDVTNKTVDRINFTAVKLNANGRTDVQLRKQQKANIKDVLLIFGGIIAAIVIFSKEVDKKI